MMFWCVIVVLWFQVAEQVGELLIHCRYGCKLIPDGMGEYEVDSSGKKKNTKHDVKKTALNLSMCRVSKDY